MPPPLPFVATAPPKSTWPDSARSSSRSASRTLHGSEFGSFMAEWDAVLADLGVEEVLRLTEESRMSITRNTMPEQTPSNLLPPARSPVRLVGMLVLLALTLAFFFYDGASVYELTTPLIVSTLVAGELHERRQPGSTDRTWQALQVLALVLAVALLIAKRLG